MTSTTIPLDRTHAAAQQPGWVEALAALIHRLQWLPSKLRMPAPVVPEAALQLLRLAEAYETTQPSYAADLRAAALQSMGSRID